jgi:Salmonella virulence plasmid 65kDa B protein/Insecticide toxin TcdB middle/N-terminal region
MTNGAPANPQGPEAREPSGTSVRDGAPAGRQSSGPVLPAITTPRGGGAIIGIGEKFGTNPVTGTASMTVSIPVSAGRSGFGPSLTLSYDSGNGNGPWGFGWALGLPSISRRTDKGLPRYADAEESDVFLLSGAEDLVPLLQDDGSRQADTTSVPGFRINRYRPRIEGPFARIERWADLATGVTHWRSIDRSNVTTLYGAGADSRIEDGRRVFEWLICESHDDRGNAVVYEYVPEDGAGLGPADPGGTGRDHARKRYLKRILYANQTSRLVRPDAADWLFEVVFEYADEHLDPIPPDPGRPVDDQLERVRASVTAAAAWPVRIDPFSTYRAGFEVRTLRRCSKILMFHRFPELGPEPCLVRSTDFEYDDLDLAGRDVPVEEELAHPGSTRFASFLGSIVQAGYTRTAADRTYVRKTKPPLEFSYSRVHIDEAVHTLDEESRRNLPIGLDGRVYQWVDLDGGGLPGILSEQAGTWLYKRNLGEARFGATEALLDRPSSVNLEVGRGQLLDLEGDGRLDAVVFAGADPGFFARTDDGSWAPHRSLTAVPAVLWDDANLRFADLTGDGRADMLLTQEDAFTWYASRGEDGFEPGRRVPQPDNGGLGPRLVFADGERALYLADMSGDGLLDLVRIRNGQVAYWPGLGYGRFGDRIVLANSPWFDRPDAFDQRRIRLADVDGSNTTDIVYLGGAGVQIYFNQSGNRLTGPRRLRAFPETDEFSTIHVADLLGNGTACLVWSSSIPAATGNPLRYVDLMGGTKPHLLVATANNLGSETHVEYASSTASYLADLEAGRPWITRLPFPVHVVRRVESVDRVSGSRFVTRYAYHHGYFDPHEREFRGFAMVEQRDTEQYADLVRAGPLENESEASHVPPVLTRTWYHTGAFRDRDHISDHLADEYYREPGLRDAEARAQLLPDTVLPPELDAETQREACRALKGAMLRQ